jgi:hypothetical protein
MIRHTHIVTQSLRLTRRALARKGIEARAVLTGHAPGQQYGRAMSEPLVDVVRAVLAAMPDRAGATATIEGVDVERTGTDGWTVGPAFVHPAGGTVSRIGNLEWATGEILRRVSRR